jgi:hypothetical protein
MLKNLTLVASRQGIRKTQMATWIHRKYGDLIVLRELSCGGLGTSLPCVLCRKALERMSIQWRAHVGTQWFKSTDDDVPQSKPTQKQRLTLGFT